MNVKTFEAFNMKDAIKSIKSELGADAVILSTKQKTLPGNDSVPIFEIRAASAHTANRLQKSTPPSITDRDLSQRLEQLDLKIAQFEDSTPTKRQVQMLESGLRDLKVLLLETLRGKEGSPLKDLPSVLINADRQLRAMGVDDTYIADLMKHLRGQKPATDKPVDEMEAFYRDLAIRWFMKRTKIAPRWPVMAGTNVIQVFVGSTGIGKSTLCAKLAAHYARKNKAKVLIVSYDTKRLAASEQMRIFAKILGVEFASIHEAHELGQVLKDRSNIELTIVDTAGRNPKVMDDIDDLQRLKELERPLDFNLCVSAAQKEVQLDCAMKCFAPLGLASVAFTKLDETWSFGEIFNLSAKWSVPLSFFSIGQQVPEDLERATRERVIERIFGL